MNTKQSAAVVSLETQSAQRSTAQAAAAAQRLAARHVPYQALLDLLGGDQVFESRANALEQGYLITAGAGEGCLFCEFVEVPLEVIAADDAFTHGEQEVAGFGESAVVGVDRDCGAFDGDGVDFAGVGLKGANQIQMGAGTEQVSVEERGGRGRARAQDVGVRRASGGIAGLDRQAEFKRHLLGGGASMGKVTRA